ncbi:hypothetical protein NLI96_g2302 [Meripilus lineatus]|uniref:Uncharacterized protein n=1 Tax=Meripilus lineatus TaxID=2056292 RepID=A0AAD5VAX2_9APHY|nr:hypothetical protein NLI96_g2302 [Physisporinus lineatus]
MNTPEDKLKELFTMPSPAPTNFGLTPGRLPGPTYDSAQALLECLRHNHLKQHIFFNDRGFHKYVVSHSAKL